MVHRLNTYKIFRIKQVKVKIISKPDNIGSTSFNDVKAAAKELKGGSRKRVGAKMM